MKYNLDALRQSCFRGAGLAWAWFLARSSFVPLQDAPNGRRDPWLNLVRAQVPNVTARGFSRLGGAGVSPSIVERVKSQDVHRCLEG